MPGPRSGCEADEPLALWPEHVQHIFLHVAKELSRDLRRADHLAAGELEAAIEGPAVHVDKETQLRRLAGAEDCSDERQPRRHALQVACGEASADARRSSCFWARARATFALLHPLPSWRCSQAVQSGERREPCASAPSGVPQSQWPSVVVK